MVHISSELDLRVTLERIVEAACRLTGARYAELGVLGSDQRTLTELVTFGEPTRPGPGACVPGPRTCVGVPIRIRGTGLGNLCLTDKPGGDFTDEDQDLLTALAAAAGAAVDNARRYTQMRRRQRWLEAAAEITAVLLGDVRRTAALRLVASRAREVAEADLAMVLLPDIHAPDRVVVEVADRAATGAEPGASPDREALDLIGASVPVPGSEFEAVLGDGHLTVVGDLFDAARWPGTLHTGTALLVPLSAGGATLGALVVAYRPGSVTFPEDPDMALVETFAGQAALALERSRAHEEREMLAVLSDRERIARDLHDVVIQRLFAAGMQLQGATHAINRTDVLHRVNSVVDDLDNTIRDIRGAIFELRTPVYGDLRAEIRSVIDAARNALGFRPLLTMDGPIDSAVADELRPTVVAVLREALSNAARHAKPSNVDVRAAVEAGRLVLTVTDDGIGPAEIVARGGLVNLRKRAEELAGGLEIGPADPRGTRLRWWVPLR